MKRLLFAYLLPIFAVACGRSESRATDHTSKQQLNHPLVQPPPSDETPAEAVIPDAPPLPPPLYPNGVIPTPGRDGTTKPKTAADRAFELQQALNAAVSEKEELERAGPPIDLTTRLQVAALQDRIDRLVEAQAEAKKKKVSARRRRSDAAAGSALKIAYLGHEEQPLLVKLSGLDPTRDKKMHDRVAVALRVISKKFDKLAQSLHAMAPVLNFEPSDDEEVWQRHITFFQQQLFEGSPLVMRFARDYDELRPRELIDFYEKGYINANVWELFWEKQGKEFSFLRYPGIVLDILDTAYDVTDLRQHDAALNQQIGYLNTFAASCAPGLKFFDLLAGHFMKETVFQNLFAAKNAPHTLKVLIAEAQLPTDWPQTFLAFLQGLKVDREGFGAWLMRFDEAELERHAGFLDILAGEHRVQIKVQAKVEAVGLKPLASDFASFVPLHENVVTFIKKLTAHMADQSGELDQIATMIKYEHFLDLFR